jgi:hypothetical protein
MKEIILSEQKFTALRDKIERCIDLLSPLSILGFRGLQATYANINKGRQESTLTAPSAADLWKLGDELFAAIRTLLDMDIVGEPSTHNSLDPVALANQERLEKMLVTVNAELDDEKDAVLRAATDQPPDQAALNETLLSMLMTHVEEEGEIVSLARAKCQLQFEALLNKLSRAFQKPDFCLRRDAFSPADRDRLLPIALSWDEDWYYGEDIKLDPALANEVVTVATCCDETQSHPAESPPAGEPQPPAPSAPETAPSETHPQSAG